MGPVVESEAVRRGVMRANPHVLDYRGGRKCMASEELENWGDSLSPTGLGSDLDCAVESVEKGAHGRSSYM